MELRTAILQVVTPQPGARDTEDVEAEEGFSRDLRPVFRSSPFTAEARRRLVMRKHARILIVDEGNCCR